MDLGLSSIIGSGIGGLGSLLSGSIQYNNQKKLLRQQNEYNLNMANLEYERNLDMWNRQNVYNSPVEQISRLKAAGLNPNLMYGQGNVGNASGAPEFNAPRSELARYNGDFGVQQFANSVSNGINAYVQTQQRLSEIRRTDADTDLQILKAIGQQRQNARSEIELRYLDDIQRQTLENLETSNVGQRVQNQFLDQKRLQFEAERPYRLQLVEEAVTQNKFLNSLNPLTRRHLIYRINNLLAQYEGKDLENHITRTLIDTGIDLRGGKLERAVNQILDMIDEGDWSLSKLGKAIAVGAIGLIK